MAIALLVALADFDDQGPPPLRDPAGRVVRRLCAVAGVQTTTLASLASIILWSASTDEPVPTFSGTLCSLRAATNVSRYSRQFGRAMATLSPGCEPAFVVEVPGE